MEEFRVVGLSDDYKEAIRTSVDLKPVRGTAAELRGPLFDKDLMLLHNGLATGKL